ncbi:unnamed protein product [Nezara viridula]|uniref:Lipase domain-containing protein n=1 Tax=Nezara viridula TaxID=85310 RepID=A0A9P0MXQ9_NEZVI|nr:unnamed protein product [Nezara viridula]
MLSKLDLLKELLCSAMTLIYATNPYTVQMIPKGDCQYCCPIIKGDMKLFLNVYEFGQEMEFDWENSSDWRYLNNNRTNVIYIHGFTEQASGPASTEMRQAFMSTGRENLIVVDWSSLAAGPWYHSAVANTKVVAKWLAGVIDSLVIRGLPLASFHVIGFSLGAEIAGLTAKKVTVGKLRRVTGLDPALPLFHVHEPVGRLAVTDAEFVDVIHTDGGIFGFDVPIGHADFFPNGGKPAQPGCRIESVVHTGKLNEFVACSHNRAWMFFAESVRNPYAFPAYKCHDYHAFVAGKCPPEGKQAYMGYLADPSLRGNFFLGTRPEEPFGFGRHEDPLYDGAPTYHQALQPSTPGQSGHSVPATHPGIDMDLLPLSLLESKGRFRGLRAGIPRADEEETQYDREEREMEEEDEEEAPESYEEEVEAVAAMYQYLLPTLADSPDLEFHLLPYDYGRESTEDMTLGDLEVEDTGDDNDEDGTRERRRVLDSINAIGSILNIFNMDQVTEANMYTK